MTVTLITFTKKGDRKTFDLTKPTVVIGRKTDADLRVPLADISRSHCEFTLQNGNVHVRDLDSSNGTFVNGEQVTEKEIEAGDVIRLGPITFTVQIDGKPENIEPPKAPEAPKAASKAGSQAPTIASKQQTDVDVDDFDIDDLDDLDIDDMSDLDLDEDFDLSDDLDEVDELEEIGEEDVIEDDK